MESIMDAMTVDEFTKGVDEMRGIVLKNQSHFNFSGYYIWRPKDEIYERLLELGYKVKEGRLFGMENYYRASIMHLDDSSVEFLELKRMLGRMAKTNVKKK